MGFELKRRRTCGVCGMDLEVAKRNVSKALVYDDHQKSQERAEKLINASPRSYLGWSFVEAIVAEAERLTRATETYEKAISLIAGVDGEVMGLEKAQVARTALEEVNRDLD